MIRYLLLLGTMVLAAASLPAPAAEMRCSSGGIVVTGTLLRDVQDGCEAVGSAVEFFQAAGLPVPKGVSIKLVDSQSAPLLAAHEQGSYDARLNEIRVLAFIPTVKATEGNEPGLGRIATRAHWRSYIVHELAHAAIHGRCDKTLPSRAVHEYIAAVAQLATLPKQVLDDLLEPYLHLAPFRDMAEITETYYLLNPHFFAVKSYSHYRQVSVRSADLCTLLRLPN